MKSIILMAVIIWQGTVDTSQLTGKYYHSLAHYRVVDTGETLVTEQQVQVTDSMGKSTLLWERLDGYGQEKVYSMAIHDLLKRK